MDVFSNGLVKRLIMMVVMMMMVMIRTREDGKMVGIVLMIPANNGIYVSELGLDEHLCGGH